MHVRRLVSTFVVLAILLVMILKIDEALAQTVRGQVVQQTPYGPTPAFAVPVELTWAGHTSTIFSDRQGLYYFYNVLPGSCLISIKGTNPPLHVQINVTASPYTDVPTMTIPMKRNEVQLDEFKIEQDHVKKLNIENADLYLLADTIHRKDRNNIIIFKKNNYIINKDKNDYDKEVARIDKLSNNIKEAQVLVGDEVSFTYNDKQYKVKIIEVMSTKIPLRTDTMKVQLFEIR